MCFRAGVALILGCVLIQGCAPSLGLKLSVPNVPDSRGIQNLSSDSEPVRVRVGTFIDSRQTDTLAVIDGREVGSNGSLASVVQEGFDRYLRDAGARIVLLNAPIIEGEITQCQVTITPKFPASEARAQARLKITVRDDKGSVVYRANYSGEAGQAHPFLSESAVRDLLAQAIGSAIEEAVKDQDLVTQLSFSRPL